LPKNYEKRGIEMTEILRTRIDIGQAMKSLPGESSLCLVTANDWRSIARSHNEIISRVEELDNTLSSLGAYIEQSNFGVLDTYSSSKFADLHHIGELLRETNYSIRATADGLQRELMDAVDI